MSRFLAVAALSSRRTCGRGGFAREWESRQHRHSVVSASVIAMTCSMSVPQQRYDLIT
jgi:CRISPR/Cas system CSM-associated protein Csm4 (group 5 of RAMP superfamily)